MLNARDVCPEGNDDQQLDHNFKQMEEHLALMVEGNENEDPRKATCEYEDTNEDGATCTSGVLSEIQENFGRLRLCDVTAPLLEFHGLDCLQQIQKRSRHFAFDGSPAKKSRSGGVLVTGPKQKQLQKENVWNRKSKGSASADNIEKLPITIEKLHMIGLHGDCLEHNAVLRLMNLFRSLHDHLTADLGFSRQNSMPSDYLFDMPVKSTMPKSLNVRYQLQVLCTKVERFLVQQRRTLESNRHFDFEKYDECDKLLKGFASYLDNFKLLLKPKMRNRNGNSGSNADKFHTQRMERLLIGLRDWIKAAHLSVHVFNWEMDLEHRYSGAMTESHKSLNERAILLSGAELRAAEARGISAEDLFIAQRYKLGGPIYCVLEQHEFLSALIANPETYFPPSVVAICGPQKLGAVSMEQPSASEEEFEETEEVPSSPPRHTGRVPRFRS
nr:SD15546p [Drosophila melanogaster]ABC48726.1 bag of marbles [Drosophila melanogaster]ABC48731.1 bag of marbles [Drosophila melanogaster]ABC48732.1 bag of marbles [Drosophila melanogaster]ABC48734.1 bag of marbles [Drosophila melanogaster]